MLIVTGEERLTVPLLMMIKSDGDGTPDGVHWLPSNQSAAAPFQVFCAASEAWVANIRNEQTIKRAFILCRG